MSPHEGNNHHDSIHADNSSPPGAPIETREPADMTRIPPKIGSKITIIAAIALAILAIGFFIVYFRKSADAKDLASETAKIAAEPLPVDVVRIEPSANLQTLALPGETAGWYESTVYVRVSGYVRNWKADIGDKVKKGQQLCDIETPDLDADLAAADAKLKASQASVQVEQANEEFAQTTFERWWQSPKGYVSEQEKQQKKAEYDSAKAKVAAAQAQANLDQASVDRLQAMEGFKKVVAPYDGVITQRRIDIGDLVTAGSASGTTPLYMIAQADRIRTFVDVPQHVARGIVVDMPAEIITDQYRDRRFVGKVARTSNAINPASRTLRVEVDIANPDLALMPGMYVRTSFQLQQSPLLEVPASALQFRQAGPEVAVVGDDNRVQFHNVTIVHDEGDFVLVEGSLQANDRVALNISSQVVDGQVVAPQQSDQAGPPPVASDSQDEPVTKENPVAALSAAQH
jgi:RND family efflux transporter MFP subunit